MMQNSPGTYSNFGAIIRAILQKARGNLTLAFFASILEVD
jgi:hypothetical protein